MSTADAIILGIVEGFSEFLPISSTGHLILVSDLLGLTDDVFTASFAIAIQLGAILSVVTLYWRKLFFDPETMKRLVVAFIPTGVVGFFGYGLVKELLGSPLIVVVVLFVGGVVLIVFEKWHRERDDAIGDPGRIPYGTAVMLGLFQAISIIPGVSRSGATILGGLVLGMKREAIVEFSFLLAVPTMAVATGYDLVQNAGSFASAQWHLLGIGFTVSFLVAMLSVKWLLRYVRTNTFIPFGVYRIALAALFLVILARV